VLGLDRRHRRYVCGVPRLGVVPMSTNPFWEAVQPTERQQVTHEVVDHPPFFRDAVEGNKLRERVKGMTRQQMFDNGMITVHDLDDEELRAGRCRDNLGRIPKVTKTMEMVPRDLYEAMVAEHQTRTQDKFRQAMDEALSTILDIMTDPANEPRDRLDAAKYVKEQVMGKTPDRVQVAVAKAPWEEMLGDFANVSRQRHKMLEAGVIDAEVVESTVQQDVSPVHQTGHRGAPYDGRPHVDNGDGVAPGHDGERATPNPNAPTGSADGAWPAVDGFGVRTTGDPRITPAVPTASHGYPASNNATLEAQRPTNSEIIRWEQCDATELAAKRAAARDRIAKAKKARQARKATGQAMLARHKITTTLVPDAEDSDTGKLRHTVD
jgi:hypothetical protein